MTLRALVFVTRTTDEVLIPRLWGHLIPLIPSLGGVATTPVGRCRHTLDMQDRGHPGIDPRRCRPHDPLRCDSAPKPSWCATRAIAPGSFPVSAARWPTRRTACSFSPAVSLGDDGPFARASPVPLSRLCCHGSSLHPR